MRGEGVQPAAYSPRVTACVRREELKQKQERRYHPALFHRHLSEYRHLM